MRESKGRLANAAAVPPKILAANLFKLGFSGWAALKTSFDYSKVANIPRFKAIPLKTVGKAPLNKLVTPSSAGILRAALNTEV